MSDTSFVARSTGIVATWLNKVNDLVFKGRSPIHVTSTGTANAQVITLPATSLYSAYTSGDKFTYKANAANTGAMTLQVVGASALSALDVYMGGAALSAGQIQIGDIVEVTYDGTRFQVTGGTALTRFVQSGSVESDTAQNKMRQRVTFDDFLTAAQKADAITGSPTVDMTAKMQAALDSGAKVVEGVPGRTYLVSSAGTKTFRSAAQYFCLAIPPNVTVDLRGSTVKLAAAANAQVFVNKNAGTTQDADVGLINGVLDGNEANQTSPATGEMGCITLYDCLRPRVEHLRVINSRQYAGRFQLCEDGYFNHLYSKRGDGDAWAFGVSGTWNMFNCFIDNIYAEDHTNATFGSLQGNPAIFTVDRCMVGKIQGVNCGGGIKIQSPQAGLTTFGQLIFIGGANGTTNSGIKVQGQSGQADGGIVSIGEVITELSEGEGLVITESKNVQIGSWKSYQDGQAGTNIAGRVESTSSNVQIGTVYVEEAGFTGFSCEGSNTKIGSAIVKNSGQVVAAANFNIAATADGLGVGSLTSIDDQGTHTATRGMNVVVGSKNITIDDYHSRGDYTVSGNHLVDGGATNLYIGRYRIDDDDLYVRLANTTQVGNDAASSAEKDAQSVTVEARSLWKNGMGFKISWWGLTANNTNGKTQRLYFGGTAISTTALTASNAAFFRGEAIVVRTGSSAQAYTSIASQGGGTVIQDVERGNLTITDTGDIIVKTTVQCSDGGGGINANDLIVYALIVEPLE